MPDEGSPTLIRSSFKQESEDHIYGIPLLGEDGDLVDVVGIVMRDALGGKMKHNKGLV